MFECNIFEPLGEVLVLNPLSILLSIKVIEEPEGVSLSSDLLSFEALGAVPCTCQN